jgi:hypothetical protein
MFVGVVQQVAHHCQKDMNGSIHQIVIIAEMMIFVFFISLF